MLTISFVDVAPSRTGPSASFDITASLNQYGYISWHSKQRDITELEKLNSFHTIIYFACVI